MANTIPVKEKDYLDVDQPISGQNYVCLSFVSPDDIIKQKELFLFNKYMNSLSSEFSELLDHITKNAGEDYNNKVTKEIKERLQLHYSSDYDRFKSSYDDFKYKYSEHLDKAFKTQTDFKTSVRGVKIRGVYDTVGAAEKRAKTLQQLDSSFHVFVGSVGYWLPWDPCADKVENEEYLEEQLNTLIHNYKKNQVHKDMLYEQEKRDKIKEANEAVIRAEMEEKKMASELQEEDPWMKSRFAEAEVVDENSSTTVEVENNEESSNSGNSDEPKVI